MRLLRSVSLAQVLAGWGSREGSALCRRRLGPRSTYSTAFGSVWSTVHRFSHRFSSLDSWTGANSRSRARLDNLYVMVEQTHLPRTLRDHVAAQKDPLPAMPVPPPFV